jgi:putative tricarboxylic transport membrane protein
MVCKKKRRNQMTGISVKQAPQSHGVKDGPDSLILRLLPALFFLSIIVLVYYLCATSLTEQGYASGTPITNAALYPRLLVTVLLALTIVQIIKETRNTGTEHSDDLGVLTRERLIQVLQCTCLGVAYLTLLPVIGYLALTPVFVALMLVSLGVRHFINVVIFSMLLTLGCSLMFQGVFNVNLPRGVFGFALNI